MDVGGWLRGLGLERYEQALRDNDIDADVLPELTADDLTGLGINSIGHRRKLLAAIAALRAAPTTPSVTPLPATGAAPGVPSVASPSGAERRQLTVMFVDLVGSTTLAARLDPEEMQDLLRAYQDAVAGEVGRFGGHLAKFMGDGVLAYFGWPVAHEDEPERAVRAGSAAVGAVARLQAPDAEPLAARVGIATGLVVVGDLVGSEEARERVVTGETPNLAARLQALAPPGGVVVAEVTQRLLGGPFELEDLGPQALKGFGVPVRAFRVGAERGDVGRFEARRTVGRLTPMVGRDRELALLLERWRLARAGEGQGVLLTGEPGIGKSRLVRALSEALAAEAPVPVRCQCSPYRSESALWPVIRHLEQAARFDAGDGNEEKLAKLEALLRADPDEARRTVPLVASLLGVESRGRYLPLDLTPQQRRTATLDVLARELLAFARAGPVLLVVEDMHWIDPTTLDLLRSILGRVTAAPVLVLLTARPEFQDELGVPAHLTRVALNRLGRGHAAAIIDGVAGGRPLPEEVSAEIARRTDGVPLFVEELTKAVLESSLLEERQDGYELTTPLPSLAVPATLHDALMARLDRLAQVKEVAQLAACLGREFAHALLAAVSPLGEAELGEALDRLAAAELVFRRGTPPDATYTFKHALMRDAAYDSLLKSKRRRLHARIATVLEEKFAGTEARTPELLAHHYGAAGLDDRAKRCWTLAGRRAFAGSNYAEASRHFANALALVRKEPPSAERAREESELLLDRAQVIVALRGPGSVEAGRAAREAIEASEPLGGDPLHFRARWMGWQFVSMAGDLPAASDRADELVAMAERVGTADTRLQAHHARWTTAFLRGQVAVARGDIEHGLALYDIDRHRGHLAFYGAHDPGVCARGTGACVLWQAGFAARAAGLSLEATRLADELGHTFSRAVAYWQAGFLSMMTGDPEGARTWAEALAELVARTDVTLAARMAEIIGGWAATRLGEPGRGAERMEAAYRGLLEAKQLAYLTFLGTLIAGARLEMGRAEEALGFLDDVERLSVETHQRMFMPDLHRLRAEALRRLGSDGRRVGEEYRLAVRLARRQGAPALELRAATGLARWLADTNRREQAHELLRPTYGLFTDGFDTPDLRDARALLEEFR